MNNAPDIVVVGSINIDIVVPVPHLPVPGETVAGTQHLKVLGGKGANQAVAAARLGRSVQIVGRVGSDTEGDSCVGGMHPDGVDTRFVARDPEVPTGVALIAVDASGENSIVVGPGANARLSVEDVRAAASSLGSAKVTMVQLEIPMEAVRTAAEGAGGTFILNPAPAKPLPQDILERVDILTPNEVELGMLSGIEVRSDDDVVRAARSLNGPRAIAVTLGARGVVLVTDDRAVAVPAPSVDAVDTTAAGDAFCGALADALTRGEELESAVGWAVEAACVSVTRMGAQPSLPTADEVRARMSGRGAG